MTIKKMSWLINTLTIGIILLAGILLLLLSKKSEEVRDAANNRFYTILLVDELRKSSENLTTQVRIYAATGKASAEAEYNKILAVRGGQEPRPTNSQIAPGQKRVLLDLLKEYGITNEEFNLVEKANGLSNDLVALEVRAMDAVKGGSGKAPNKELALRLVYSDEYFAEVKKIMAPMDEFQNKVYKRTGEAMKLANDHLKTAQKFSLVALIMVLLIAMFNLFFNTFSVMNPIFAITKDIETIMADHKINLNKKINFQSNNEIGNLAVFFNKLIETMRDSMGKTKMAVDNLVTISEEVSSVSRQLASESEETASQSGIVASTAEKMALNINAMATGTEEASVNANEVAGAAEEMSMNMNTVAAAIEQMSASIKEIASNTADVSQIATEATTKSTEATSVMSKLGSAAKEIGQVTEVIKKIADKTNLLALNATIEAASAGESGKGFAVVAGEIKELANQSASSAEDIARRIGGIQTGTNAAVKVISDVSGIIENINHSVESIAIHVDQQTKAANEIANNVAQANTGAKRVAGSIGEVAKGANDISKNAGEAASGVANVSNSITNINQAAKKSVQDAMRSNESAGNLVKIAGELSEAVSQFKV